MSIPSGPPQLNGQAISLFLRRWLFEDALPLWWQLGADRTRGGFLSNLDQVGRPTDERRRVRVQARQVYSYAVAKQMGWTGPWKAAVGHGLDFLFRNSRGQDGLFRDVDSDGVGIGGVPLAYDQAFVLLAFGAAASVLPTESRQLRCAARDLLGVIISTYGAPAGGIREIADSTGRYQSASNMHLFEAALRMASIDDDSLWIDLVDQLGNLCLNKFVDSKTGCIREFYSAEWYPVPGELGRMFSPGHQFEWAWLLAQWANLRDRPDAATLAVSLFEFGEAGVDSETGFVFNTVFDNLQPRDPTARIWSQSERLKAAHLLSVSDGSLGIRSGYERASQGAFCALRAHLDIGAKGLWRESISAANGFNKGPAPATSLYHLVSAAAELENIRLDTT